MAVRAQTVGQADRQNLQGSPLGAAEEPRIPHDTLKATLAQLKREGGALVRAYELKESLRAVVAGDLDADTVTDMLGKWCSWAQRCRIPQFVKVGRTIKKHLDGIQAAVERGLANGRHEGLNNKVRLLIRRAYGFHNAENALAMIMLVCGPITLELPYHT